MSWLWPIKTGQTFFDTWSICHLCFWVLFGMNWEAISLKNKAMNAWWIPYVVGLCGALLWELFESQVVERLGYVRYSEVWFNRWLSDPFLAMPLGVFLGMWLARHQ